LPLKKIAVGAAAAALLAVSGFVGARLASAPSSQPAPASAPAPLPVAQPTVAPVAAPVTAPVPPKPGSIRVVAHGGWLDVSVDGEREGRTPLRGEIEVPAGQHTVTVTNAFKRFKKVQKITVDPGATTLVEINLPSAGE
jgi:hypothetical protein